MEDPLDILGIMWIGEGIFQPAWSLPVFLGFATFAPYILVMVKANGPILDMTPDGDFVTPPKPTLGTILARLAAFTVLLVVAAVTFWMALFIVPVMIILGIAAYALSRTQVRRF